MAMSLEILKKNFRSIIYTQNSFIWCKIAKIAKDLYFCYDTKLVAMASLPSGLKNVKSFYKNSS